MSTQSACISFFDFSRSFEVGNSDSQLFFRNFFLATVFRNLFRGLVLQLQSPALHRFGMASTSGGGGSAEGVDAAKTDKAEKVFRSTLENQFEKVEEQARRLALIKQELETLEAPTRRDVAEVRAECCAHIMATCRRVACST